MSELESAITELYNSMVSIRKAGKELANLYIKKYGEDWQESDTYGYVEFFSRELN